MKEGTESTPALKPSISFIIPLKDEEATLEELFTRIAEQANEHASTWDILFVDDGSDDGSWNVITKLARENPEHVRAIRFRRNQGKAAGLAAGYAEVSGDLVFTLDADLQDDPAEIPRFIAKINEGYDIVSGWKQKRHDPWHKVLPSRVFNAMLSRVNGVKLHDHNCGFKCYRREVVKDLPMYGEMHRMVPSLASIEGYRTAEISVLHHARQFGVSKYGVKRFLRGFMDMWTVYFIKNYRERPLHLMGGLGLVFLLVGAFLGLVSFIPGLPTAFQSGLLTAGLVSAGVAPALFMIGLLSELITNRHYSQQHALPVIDRIDMVNRDAVDKIVPLHQLVSTGEAVAANVKGGKILIADDDRIVRSVCARLLETEGWEVSEAQSGEEALAKLSVNYDVVLLDLYMPGLSGIETLPKIKAIAPYTQVVVASGTDHPRDGAAAIKSGAFDFISKPIQKTELLETTARARQATLALRPNVRQA